MKSIEIIAEIGGNFTTPSEGIKLVDAAKKSGATSVKLQTYKADTVASSTDAVLDMENTGVVSQHQLFQKFELEYEYGPLHALSSSLYLYEVLCDSQGLNA